MLYFAVVFCLIKYPQQGHCLTMCNLRQSLIYGEEGAVIGVRGSSYGMFWDLQVPTTESENTLPLLKHTPLPVQGFPWVLWLIHYKFFLFPSRP
jgi:hypothetical protein